MNGHEYLVKYGWKPGEGLKATGLKKALLVKHKRDSKGLGVAIAQADSWWERLYDGQLKNLHQQTSDSGMAFDYNRDQVQRNASALYSQFRLGGLLEGSISDPKYLSSSPEIAKEYVSEGSDKIHRPRSSSKTERKSKSKKVSGKSSRQEKSKKSRHK